MFKIEVGERDGSWGDFFFVWFCLIRKLYPKGHLGLLSCWVLEMVDENEKEHILFPE